MTDPPYTVDPHDLDDDQHPTGAWTVGEQLDDETRERLARLLQQGAE